MPETPNDSPPFLIVVRSDTRVLEGAIDTLRTRLRDGGIINLPEGSLIYQRVAGEWKLMPGFEPNADRHGMTERQINEWKAGCA